VGPVVQIAGALAIRAAFVLAQAKVLVQHCRSYLVLNLAGATVLAVDALLEQQWGFLLLEGVWAMVSAWSLARSIRRPALP
jgi:hypothetical protein